MNKRMVIVACFTLMLKLDITTGYSFYRNSKNAIKRNYSEDDIDMNIKSVHKINGNSTKITSTDLVNFTKPRWYNDNSRLKRQETENNSKLTQRHKSYFEASSGNSNKKVPIKPVRVDIKSRQEQFLGQYTLLSTEIKSKLLFFPRSEKIKTSYKVCVDKGRGDLADNNLHYTTQFDFRNSQQTSVNRQRGDKSFNNILEQTSTNTENENSKRIYYEFGYGKNVRNLEISFAHNNTRVNRNLNEGNGALIANYVGLIQRLKRDTFRKGHIKAKDISVDLKISPGEAYRQLLVLYDTTLNLLNFTMDPPDPNVTIIAGEHCMAFLNSLFQHVEDDGNVYCNSSWDRYSCWPRTLAGTIAYIPCPGYLEGIKENNNATKLCMENGTWADKAVYDFCIGEDKVIPTEEGDEHITAMRIIYNTGFTISTLMLVIALSIFLHFRSLRCLRNLIHCHLIVTFILKNIVWIIMSHTLLSLQHSSYSWLCKALTGTFNFANSTNFFWMFVEGLYLHIIIVWTYSADKIRLWYLIVIGWGLPFINIVAWAVTKVELDNDQCWIPSDGGMSHYDYIYVGPILLVLFANIIFLSTIVWVLITKLRASHSLETRQYRKAVRATVILFPLLGIAYVLFIIPPTDDPTVKLIFKYINAIMQSFQGLLVAIFYCFLNGEVKGVLKKKLTRYHDARSLSTKYTKTSMGWSRGASEYGASVALGNGQLTDSYRRPNSSDPVPPTENIPLTETPDDDKELD